MYLAASRLRSRVTIWRPSSVPTGKGGYLKGWTLVAENVPAEVISQNGREAVIANTLQGVSSCRITMRFREGLKASDQIVHNGEALNIVAPPSDRDGTRVAVEVFASSVSDGVEAPTDPTILLEDNSTVLLEDGGVLLGE